jgi:hypothetical protein
LHRHGRSNRRGYCFDALGTATLGWDAVGGFDYHQISDKELDSVSIEINGGALSIGLRDYTATVLKVLDVLPNFLNCQRSSCPKKELCTQSPERR